jgi:cytochrome c551/c552
MRPLTIPIVLFALTATGYNNVSATEPKGAEAAETKYLTFQRMTGLHGYAGPRLLPGHFALSKAQLEEFVRDVTKAIGARGDVRTFLPPPPG